MIGCLLVSSIFFLKAYAFLGLIVGQNKYKILHAKKNEMEQLTIKIHCWPRRACFLQATGKYRLNRLQPLTHLTGKFVANNGQFLGEFPGWLQRTAARILHTVRQVRKLEYPS
jgi:hypothetical protein